MQDIKYYLVGGAVRDMHLMLPCKDFDYAVEAPSYQAMKDDILAKGITIFQEREEFLTIRGSHSVHGGVDYVLCRKESGYSDGRRPDEVQPGTIYDDLARRDFTVNAMAIDQETGNLIDPFGGLADLDTKTLKCVGNAMDRFREDHLRILRAVRFKITKGFYLSSELDDLLCDVRVCDLLKSLPKQRIYEELVRCFDANTPAALHFFQNYRALSYTIFDDIGMQLVVKGPSER